MQNCQKLNALDTPEKDHQTHFPNQGQKKDGENQNHSGIYNKQK